MTLVVCESAVLRFRQFSVVFGAIGQNKAKAFRSREGWHKYNCAPVDNVAQIES